MTVVLFCYCWSIYRCSPANTRRWPNVGLTLGQRRRRWANVSPTFDQRLVFAGLCVHHAGPFFLARLLKAYRGRHRREAHQVKTRVLWPCKNYTGSCSCSSADTMIYVLFYNEISCPQQSCSQSFQVNNYFSKFYEHNFFF